MIEREVFLWARQFGRPITPSDVRAAYAEGRSGKHVQAFFRLAAKGYLSVSGARRRRVYTVPPNAKAPEFRGERDQEKHRVKPSTPAKHALERAMGWGCER